MERIVVGRTNQSEGYTVPVPSQEILRLIQQMDNSPPFTLPEGVSLQIGGRGTAEGRRAGSAARRNTRDRWSHIDTKAKAIQHFRNVRKEFKVLRRLERLMDSAKGGNIQFPIQGQADFVLDRSILNQYWDSFDRELAGIPVVFQFSRGRRTKVDADSFKGVWSVIVAGPAILDFIANANLGLDTGSPAAPISEFILPTDEGYAELRSLPQFRANGVRLQDRLSEATRVQLGNQIVALFQRNTLRGLFDIHRAADDLSGVQAAGQIERQTGQAAGSQRSLIRSSQAMMNAFGGSIPAEYALEVINAGPKYSKRDGRLLGQKTVNKKLPNDGRLNTYQVIQAVRPSFNPESFSIVFFNSIIGVNSLSLTEQLQVVAEANKSPISSDQAAVQASEILTQYRDQLLLDTAIVRAVKQSWNIANESYNELHSRLTSRGRASRAQRRTSRRDSGAIVPIQSQAIA